MKTNDETEPIEVFAGTIWQVEMVKSLLENASVNAYLVDEIMGTMNPWLTAAGGAGPLKVFVSKTDYENAKQVVDEYEKNLKY
jgi:hypothetical protein